MGSRAYLRIEPAGRLQRQSRILRGVPIVLAQPFRYAIDLPQNGIGLAGGVPHILLFVTYLVIEEEKVDDTERLVIEQACTRLINEYVRRIDRETTEKGYELFTDDCRLILNNRGQTFNGRKEWEFVAQNQTKGQHTGNYLQRHVVSGIIIDVKDKDHASGTALVLLYRSRWNLAKGPSPILAPEMFHWDGDYVRTPTGWKFSRHELSPYIYVSPYADWPNVNVLSRS